MHHRGPSRIQLSQYPVMGNMQGELADIQPQVERENEDDRAKKEASLCVLV